jgi:hypothetical protein
MKYFLTLVFVFVGSYCYAQVDTAFLLLLKSLDTADILKYDTAIVPEDALTKKIRVLMKEKHGLNIESILTIKMAEEQEKKKAHTKKYFDDMVNELKSGHTARLIENSVINVYRRTFSESEVDELIRFYKTPLGKKMEKDNFLLLVRTVKDTEQLIKLATKAVEARSK